MAITIALAGNPNSGKTTLFNALTGSNQYVGNWPGVTVEKKEGKMKGNKDVSIMDLPGIYSLSPYTLEEVVSRNYLINEHPDVILNIVDGTNIERNLYLTTQLTEMGIPVVVAVNMMDVVKRRGDQINPAALSKAMGCEVVEISALKGTGVLEAANRAVQLAQRKQAAVPGHVFDERVERVLGEISARLDGSVAEEKKRFFAVKLFERDDKLEKLLPNRPGVEDLITALEKEMDDDAESIITNERYTYISKIIGDSVVKANKSALTPSDKIDRVVTNRWMALPIFVAVMFFVYYISITTVGTLATDWANDGVFGDGWHLFGIGTADHEEAAGEYEVQQAKLEAYLGQAADSEEEAELALEAVAFDPESGEELSAEAQGALDDVMARAQAENLVASFEEEDEDGNVETVPVSYAEVTAAMEADEPDPAAFGIWIPGIPVLVENLLAALGTADWLNGLILDGIVGGVGAVLGFVPQMLILFLLLAILEDIGYMARVAFIMDRIFRKFGLSGKSFIPMLIGSGCSVPGIMASRTIENDRDRKMTIMTTSFIPCGAKMPVVALISGVLFGGAWWVAPSAYFVGVAAIVLSGIMLKKTKAFSGEPAPFVMELPSYHAPKVIGVLRSMWERGWSFIKKAGTIILLSSILIWLLSSFGFVDGRLVMVENLDHSVLAVIGNAVSWIFSPLGFGSWQATVATLMGLVAKEEVVGVFGVLFGVSGDALEIVDAGNFGALAPISAVFTGLTAYSFLVFNLLCAPCFAAIGAIRREMNSAKWTWFAIGYQCALAYAVSLCFYQFGLLIQTGVFGVGTGVAAAVLLFILVLLFRPYQESKRLRNKV